MSPRAKHRQPSFNQQVDALKRARAVENPEDYQDETPVWCFKRVALSGPFRWSSMDVEKTREDVYSSLRDYGTMLWKHIDDPKNSCHDFEIDQLAEPVRSEMRKRCEGIESGYQLAVSNKGRILGVRIGRVMSLVLWDAEHQGFPTQKKHT